MARHLAQRIVHLVNLPLRLNLPASRENITEFSLRTIPSASKIEIKRILQFVYGLKVSKVNTLNMDGKRKRRAGGWMATSPAYKKAYIVLQEPVSLPENIFPFNFFEAEEKKLQEEEKKEEAAQRTKFKRRHRNQIKNDI